MSYVKIFVHAVWCTKNRFPFLKETILPVVISHITQNAAKKGIYIDRLNGYTDHLHCLLSLPVEMTIAKAMNLIKGESSYWINKQKLTTTHFEWADEYYAAGVSNSLINKVRRYIDNQKCHHEKKMFEQVYREFNTIHNRL